MTIQGQKSYADLDLSCSYRKTEQLGERELLEAVGDLSQEPQTLRLSDCCASSHDTLTLSQSATGSVEPEREDEEGIEEFDDDLFWQCIDINFFLKLQK